MDGMHGDFRKRPSGNEPPDEADDPSLKSSLALFRPVLAFAGMGALVGMLVGGTTVGFPIVIASTVLGAVGGGILGSFLKIDD
jgi:hypothetical protein